MAFVKSAGILTNIESDEMRRKILELWLELGSLEKVSKSLEAEGIVNPKDGVRYSGANLSRKVWDYVLDNSEEAFEITNKHGEVSPEYWEQLLVRKAYVKYVISSGGSRPKFYKWLKEKGLYDKYKDYRKADARPLV